MSCPRSRSLSLVDIDLANFHFFFKLTIIDDYFGTQHQHQQRHQASPAKHDLHLGTHANLKASSNNASSATSVIALQSMCVWLTCLPHRSKRFLRSCCGIELEFSCATSTSCYMNQLTITHTHIHTHTLLLSTSTTPANRFDYVVLLRNQ
jgi:hypothetical protein